MRYSDDELEAELRRLAAEREPVPAQLHQAAVEAFSWRDIDAEIAELVYDSLLDADAASLVRGPAGQRLVSFAAGEVTIDLEVTSAGPGRTVMGQIDPPQRATVDIRHPQGTVTVEADDLGRFQSGPLPPGPASLRLRPPPGAAGPAVITDWIAL
ncbi:MAG: hypothetical protein J2P30_12845 [Actinobacteria bacterium]|nr:hypothetical protein [Actinomycetota bacterium]